MHSNYVILYIVKFSNEVQIKHCRILEKTDTISRQEGQGSVVQNTVFKLGLEI